jgi:hypothetical protein
MCRMPEIDNNTYIVYIVAMAMILKQIKFDEQDLKAVEAIQQMYGCDSFSQAVRLAARIVATNPRIGFPLPPSPKQASKRKPMSLRGIIQLPATLTAAEIDRALEAATSRDQQEALAEWTLDAQGKADFVPTHQHLQKPAVVAEPVDP